jgi:hypothetical protein
VNQRRKIDQIIISSNAEKSENFLLILPVDASQVLPFFVLSFVVFSLFLFFGLRSLSHPCLSYGSLILSQSNRSRTLSFTGQPYVAKSPPTAARPPLSSMA